MTKSTIVERMTTRDGSGEAKNMSPRAEAAPKKAVTALKNLYFGLKDGTPLTAGRNVAELRAKNVAANTTVVPRDITS